MRKGFGLSFFLCRLTDSALTEGFSDYRDLIAQGKHFLAIMHVSGLAGWLFAFAPCMVGTALLWHAALAHGDAATAAWVPTGLHPRSSQAFGTSPPEGHCLPLCSCLGGPWRAWIRSPTLHLARAAWAARRVLGGRGGPGQPPTPLCHTGAQPG